MTKNEKDKTYVYNGHAASVVIWTLHDGSTDQFGNAPPYVRKQFKSVASIRSHMNAAVSSKVYALVLSDYKSKGVYQYEVSNVKIRSGFGKSDIKHVPPAATKAADLQKMFGGVSVKAPTQETTDGNVPESNNNSSSSTVRPDESSEKVSEHEDVDTKSTKSGHMNTITPETASHDQTADPTQPVTTDVT